MCPNGYFTDLFNAHAMAFQKQHSMFPEEDPALQDYIKKQKAYFKEIDEFELPEEEVGSDEELD